MLWSVWQVCSRLCGDVKLDSLLFHRVVLFWIVAGRIPVVSERFSHDTWGLWLVVKMRMWLGGVHLSSAGIVARMGLGFHVSKADTVVA